MSARFISLQPSESSIGVVVDPTNMIEVDFYVESGALVAGNVVYELMMAKNRSDLASTFGALNRFGSQVTV